jgi:hypothetical protein
MEWNDFYHLYYTKINLKCIKNLNLRPETIRRKHKRSTGRYRSRPGFFDNVPKEQERKAKIDKWDYFRIRSSAQKRKESTQWEATYRMRKMFVKYSSNQRQISKLYKEIKKPQ